MQCSASSLRKLSQQLLGFGQGRDKVRWNCDENGGSAHLLATENLQARELAEVPL
jgi:hypothetical protein